jgi:hypothetical protein
MTFDEARDAFPAFGFALYALEPGGPCIFEVHTPEGDIFTFQAETAEAAVSGAFAEPEPAPALPSVFD